MPASRRPDEEAMLDALALELGHAARWQGLAAVEVSVGPRIGELAAPLRARLVAAAS